MEEKDDFVTVGNRVSLSFLFMVIMGARILFTA